MTTIDNVMQLMERLAPARLAEPWDNSGLQVGDPKWLVSRIRLALDATPAVVEAACNANIDLLITHHPLIFKPLSSINATTPIGSIIQTCMQHQLGIFCAHTNLDSAQGGVNDALARLLELQKVQPLRPHTDGEMVKIVVYVPREHEVRLLEALFETSAGQIGHYSCCAFRNPGTGSFLPLAESSPFIGTLQQVNHVPEIRIEAVAVASDAPAIIAHLRRNHPYETMACDVYPLQARLSGSGPGRIGHLTRPPNQICTLESLAQQLKHKLQLSHVKIAGAAGLPVEVVALCCGSGSSLTTDFLKSPADVYISGDMRYHDARTIEIAGKGLIDIGHFASEHPVLTDLKQYLEHELVAPEHSVTVDICLTERDAFVSL